MGLISRLGDGPPPPTPDEVREALARVVPARSIMDRLLGRFELCQVDLRQAAFARYR